MYPIESHHINIYRSILVQCSKLLTTSFALATRFVMNFVLSIMICSPTSLDARFRSFSISFEIIFKFHIIDVEMIKNLTFAIGTESFHVSAFEHVLLLAGSIRFSVYMFEYTAFSIKLLYGGDLGLVNTQ